MLRLRSGGFSFATPRSFGNFSTAVVNTISAPSGTVPNISIDFSQWATDAAFKADKGSTGQTWSDEDSTPASDFVLDTTVGYGSSTKSMRYDYPVHDYGPPGCPGGYTVGRNLNFGAGSTNDQTEIWVEMVVKFSGWQVYPPGFNTVPNCGASYNPDFKLFFGRTRQSSRWELLWGNSTNGIAVGGYPGAEGTYQMSELAPDVTASLDGNWHTFRFHFRNSVIGDGRYRLWFDGVLKKDDSGFNTGVANNYIYGLALGRNRDPYPGQASSMWWGLIKVWFGNNNPGW